ncbi:hypothetical protein GCM10018781_55960 [Kitasatospora indigofera]|uniref:HD domain-containing protein n=2 Tax=Kitasatospora indigofera TaxID=67307 RepID=A0A919G6L9_9ACTN|nr:hypothetical protein GCM10018781_55960 [Kitasatospora indigofera]
MDGADPGRTALLCILHDLPETRTSDQTPVTRRYAAAAPRAVAGDQVAAAHPNVRDIVLGAIGEFEDDKTPETRGRQGPVLPRRPEDRLRTLPGRGRRNHGPGAVAARPAPRPRRTMTARTSPARRRRLRQS